MSGKRWGRNPGLFVVGGQVPSAEDVAAVAANLAATGDSSTEPAEGPAANLPVPVTIEGVHGEFRKDGEGHTWFSTEEPLTSDKANAIAAAIEWDRTAAAEPYQVDLTRSLDDTTRMGNSLSAAVRLELLADDLRASVRDERSAAERTADQLAAVEDDCEHVPMLSGRCALCGVRVDAVTGEQLDELDGLPLPADDEDLAERFRPGWREEAAASLDAAAGIVREDGNQPTLDAVRDAWDATAELPRIGDGPMTVADFVAELTPRVYAAPRPTRRELDLMPADQLAALQHQPMSAERSRTTGGAAARILNWTSRHDERSLGYGVRRLMAGPAPLVDKAWAHGPILDQGTAPPLSLHDASGCTGHAAVNAANVLQLQHVPASGLLIDDLYGHEDAMRAYDRAQELDDVPGEAYPGTSVLAVMKAGAEFGWWASYSWAFGTRDVAQALLQVGPVVIGIPWFSGMSEPGPEGIVTVTGDDLGGHCLCLFAVRMSLAGKAGPWFGALQTWGESVGDHGVVWFHHKTLAQLLHGVGEAAIPHLS